MRQQEWNRRSSSRCNRKDSFSLGLPIVVFFFFCSFVFYASSAAAVVKKSQMTLDEILAQVLAYILAGEGGLSYDVV